jgi:hypothetical protein
MIKSNELRCGVIIFTKVETEWMPLVVTPVEIEKAEHYNEYFNKNHKPIPLTAEWLERFGFVKGNQFPYIDLNTGWFCLDENSGYYRLALPNDNIGNQFRYVHQLQNLYYCLTGTELTLKDKANTL